MTGRELYDLIREVPIEVERALLAEHFKGVDFGATRGENRLHHEAILQMELHCHTVVFAAYRAHRRVHSDDFASKNITDQVGVMRGQVEQRAATPFTRRTPRSRIAAPRSRR